jgi:hypothetical protein
MPGTRQAKFIAKLMAVIWLFGIALGVAHACVVATPAPASSISATYDSQEPDSCAQACKRLCDRERTTVAKTQSAKTLDLSDSAPWVGATRGWQIDAAAHAGAAWQLAAAPPRQLALAIQTLRLTL